VFKFYGITNFRATDQRHVQAREMALQETNQQCHRGCCIGAQVGAGTETEEIIAKTNESQ